jgi:uncharacterized protein
MGLDLNHLSIIDNHAHPFLPEKENKDATSYWTTSLLPENVQYIQNLLAFRKMTKCLGQLLGLDTKTDIKSVWECRQKTYAKDPNRYIKALFENAKIENVFVDIGYPTKSISGYDVNPTDFARLVPSKIKVIVRIEPIIMELAGSGLTYIDFIDAFRQELEKQISTYDTVALKTAIAYFTGLKINNPGSAEVRQSFKAYMDDPNRFDQAGPLFNKLVHETFKIAKKYDLPVQIHTGFGNAPLLDLTKSNPLLLFDLLADENCRETPIILLHAGYPYVRETTYLTNNYPNVFIDLSQVTQFIGVGLSELLTQVLSMAPINKILYGSDGLGAPELFWWPAIHAKESLKQALLTLLSKDLITNKDADEIAVRILRQNAIELYL